MFGFFGRIYTEYPQKLKYVQINKCRFYATLQYGFKIVTSHATVFLLLDTKGKPAHFLFFMANPQETSA